MNLELYASLLKSAAQRNDSSGRIICITFNKKTAYCDFFNKYNNVSYCNDLAKVSYLPSL